MLKVLTLKLGAYALTCKLLDSMLTEIFFFVVSNGLCLKGIKLYRCQILLHTIKVMSKNKHTYSHFYY